MDSQVERFGPLVVGSKKNKDITQYFNVACPHVRILHSL
jgi:hypothetical protein